MIRSLRFSNPHHLAGNHLGRFNTFTHRNRIYLMSFPDQHDSKELWWSCQMPSHPPSRLLDLKSWKYLKLRYRFQRRKAASEAFLNLGLVGFGRSFHRAKSMGGVMFESATASITATGKAAVTNKSFGTNLIRSFWISVLAAGAKIIGN